MGLPLFGFKFALLHHVRTVMKKIPWLRKKRMPRKVRVWGGDRLGW